MIFKKGDILQFHYGIEHADCKVFCETTDSDGDRWVHMLSTEGTIVTYKRGFLLSQISGGWISFKHYGKELEPSFMVKRLEL